MLVHTPQSQTLPLIPLTLKTLLICDDDLIFHLKIKHLLEKHVIILSAYNGDEALKLIKKHSIDLIFLDIHMRTTDEGLIYIPELLKIDPNLAIMMTSCTSDFRIVRAAMREGALDYFVKNLDSEDLIITVNRTMEKKSLLRHTLQQEFEINHAHHKHILIGHSLPIQRLRLQIEKAKKSHANVLILGETGTGKELVARQLRSIQTDGTWMPFVAIDSSTIQQTTAESLLFGHEKGAFTGADRTVKGAFEEANHGILYLDEISNMPLSIQAKLLRAIQEKEITRVGASKIIPLEFRVVCASNENLEHLAHLGQFKYDLLQRLDVISIQIPPLRDRTEDIPSLVEFFYKKHNTHLSARGLHLTPQALVLLEKYPWPGNVRELENLIIYLADMVDTIDIHPKDLPSKYHPAQGTTSLLDPSHTPTSPQNTHSFYDRLAHHEKSLLQKEYDQFNGNISQLARHLKIDRSHLYTKLTQLGIHISKNRSKIHFF